MKKLLLFAFLLIAGMTYGQDTKALWELGKITFYGVDFNKAKVFGATETPAEILVAPIVIKCSRTRAHSLVEIVILA